MFLIDANVIIDVLAPGGTWRDWSMQMLSQSSAVGEIKINEIIYAEVANTFDDMDSLDQRLADLKISRAPLPYEAAFAASKAFRKYRLAGGLKTAPLPDFFIGAHAAVDGLILVTRDAARFRTYFPTVTLITPEVA